jgi:GNAT superfamily N-acetyltransferase
MNESDTKHALLPPRSAAEWAAYHAIRRDAIFAVHLPEQAYDENDADEFKPGHAPHILLLRNEVIGTIRIDVIDEMRAGFRLISIRNDLQRHGHGAIMLDLAEQLVHRLGVREISINANAQSLPFYLRHGYVNGEWRDVGPVPDKLIRVGKRMM